MSPLFRMTLTVNSNEPYKKKIHKKQGWEERWLRRKSVFANLKLTLLIALSVKQYIWIENFSSPRCFPRASDEVGEDVSNK